jgi:hypothetical protein
LELGRSAHFGLIRYKSGFEGFQGHIWWV